MISKEEYGQRVARLRDRLSAQGLEALVVSEPESIYYFTGASYKAQERPFFIIVRPQGEPVFLVPQLEESHMTKARIGAVVVYWEYPAPPGRRWIDKIADILAGTGTVGVEPGLSVENWHCLKALAENMVISVEPGIYIPDIGGVRHSDTVLVTADGYESLTTHPVDISSLTILETRFGKKMKGKLVQRFIGI